MSAVYWSHIGVLCFGFAAGLAIACDLSAIPLGLPGELALARRMGIASLTILAGYPKTRDLINYVLVLGLPVIGALVAWRSWATGDRRAYLTSILTQPTPNAGGAVPRRRLWLLVVCLVYLGISCNLGYLYRQPGGWALLAEEGVHLAWVQSLLSGGVFARDFHSIYGPMQIYPLAGLMELAGTSIPVARAYALLLCLVAYLITIVFLDQALRSRILFVSSALVLLVVFPPVVLPAPNWSYLRVALGLLSLLLTERGLGSDRGRTLFLAGAVLGQSLLFSQEVGVCAVLGIAVMLLTDGVQRRSLPCVATTAGLVASGCVISVSPLLAYFYFHDSLLLFISDFLEYPRLFALGYAALPFPTLADFLTDPGRADAMLAYWVILIYAAVATQLLVAFLLRAGVARLLLKLPLLVFGILLFRTALGRSDWHHIHFASPPAFLLLFLAMDDIVASLTSAGQCVPGRRLGATLVMAGAAGSLLTLIVGNREIRLGLNNLWDSNRGSLHWSTAAYSNSLLSLPRAQIAAGAEARGTLTKIESFLAAHTEPGQPVYFFPNEPACYFIFDRPNPTHFAMAYFAITRELRLELITDLERNRPEYVVYNLRNWRVDNIEEAIQVPEVTTYIMTHYVLFLDLGEIHILKRLGDVS